MAAAPLPPSLHPSYSPFDIFQDGGAARNTPPPAAPSLPGGPCNFVDLSHGPNGPKCGCRRFWSCQVSGPGHRTTDQMGWCMCSHHACFHDDVQNSQAFLVPLVEDVRDQENEKPRSNREPLSPVQDFASFHMPSDLGGAAMDFATLNFNSFSSNLGIGTDPSQYHPPQIHPPQSIPPGPAQDTESLPDTLSWGNATSTHGGQTPLPPIPSQCLIPHSQSASTTASSQLRYLRPFGGKGMNTLSSVSPTRNLTKDGFANINMGINSALGIVNEHTGDDANPVSSEMATPTPEPSRLLRALSPTSVFSARQSNEQVQDLADAVQDHEKRLESLEGGSIYHTALDDFSEKHDMCDLRVTELEGRMDDVERRLNDDNRSVANSYSITQRDDDATVSEASATSNATARPTERAALARLLQFEARVSQLEASALPTYTSPWEVEVVFLPFPLKGIWVEAQDFKTYPHLGGRDEGTQLPNTNSRATPMPQSLNVYDEWAGQCAGWLLPRAIATGRMIDQRLRSRGFTKVVRIRGHDARSVQLAIGNAFESILRMMPNSTGPRYPWAADPRVDKFLGLQQPWVPLRKVHKDPRLRFLTAPELQMPAVWTAPFLRDSVVMKATGMHRLYITQPEAYLQNNQAVRFHSAKSGWAWQKLRELNRVYADSQASNGGSEVPEADALEEYWAFNDRLDDPPDTRQSSMGLHQSHREASVSMQTDESTEQYFTVPSIPTTSMASPAVVRGQSPFTQGERKGSRPPDVPTGSYPLSHAPAMASPASSGRRMSSQALFPAVMGSRNQRHPSPLAPGRPAPRAPTVANLASASKVTKNRPRGTRSPSLRPYYNTPRYSNRSYTRSPSIPPHMYANTYMTPHSNTVPGYSPQQIGNGRNVRIVENEDEMMDFGDDRGSSTDPFGSESDGVMADDDDADISVYEDKADMLDNLGSDSEGRRCPAVGQGQLIIQAQQQSSQPQGPDIPRRGIEDSLSEESSLEDGDEDEDEDEEAYEHDENDEDDDDRDDEDKDDDNKSIASKPSEYPTHDPPSPFDVGDGREMTGALDDDDGPRLVKFNNDEDYEY